jgi:hypothetical protein
MEKLPLINGRIASFQMEFIQFSGTPLAGNIQAAVFIL